MSTEQQPTNDRLLGEQPPPSPRGGGGGRIFRYGGVAIVLLSLLGLGGWLYFRSARFHRQVISLLESRLKEFGLRGEIGGIGWTLRPQMVELRDLRLSNLATGARLASIGELTIEAQITDPYALRIDREVVLKMVRLRRAELHLKVNAAGEGNWAGIALPAGGAQRVRIDLSELVTTLEESRVRYQDERVGLEVELDGLSIRATQIQSEKSEGLGGENEPTDWQVDLEAGGGGIGFDGARSPIERLALGGRLGVNGLAIEQLELASPLANLARTEGRLEWAPFQLDLMVNVRARTEEVARVFFPDGLKLAGEVTCECRVEATAKGVSVGGNPQATRLVVEGAGLAGVEVRGARYELVDGRSRFGAQRARARSVKIEMVELTSVELQSPRGEVIAGQTRMTAPGALIEGVDWPGSHLAELQLDTVRADFPRQGYRVTAGAALVEGEIAGLSFEGVRTDARVDPLGLVLENLSGHIAEGEVEAAITIPFRQSLPFAVTGQFRKLPATEVFRLLSLEMVPVRGIATGEAHLMWNGGEAQTLSGKIEARFEGQTSPVAGEIPLEGPIQIEVDEGVFRFEEFQLRTRATQLSVSGTLAIEGQSDLALSLSSQAPDELLAIAASIEPLAPLIKQYPTYLRGETIYQGRLRGDLQSPRLSGKLTVEEVGLRATGIGRIAGEILITGESLRVEQGELGVGTRFAFELPFEKSARTGWIRATLDELEMAPLLAALDAPRLSSQVAGLLAGEVDLKGLPGRIDGTIFLRLNEATILGQPAQEAVAEIRFVDHVAKLSALTIQLPQTRLASDGSWNLASGAFEWKGQASQISLSALAAALEMRPFEVDGEAETRFVVSGRFRGGEVGEAEPEPFDREQLSLNMIANTSNLTINQRPVVDYRVYAGTSAQGTLRLAINTLRGPTPRQEEELLLVTVALRDPELPITIRGEVEQMEVAPFLAILAPNQRWVDGGICSGRISISGPTQTKEGHGTLERLTGELQLQEVQTTVAENRLRLASPVTILLQGGRVEIPATRLLGQGIELGLRGSLGLKAEHPLDLALRGSLDLAQLSGVDPSLSLFGSLRIEAQAKGTPQEPNLSGGVDIQNLGLSSPQWPIFLSNGNGLLTLAGERLRIESFRANANEGRLEATGELQLSRFEPREWKFDFRIDGAEFYDQDLSASLSSRLSLTGTPEGQTLSGSINTSRLEYDARIDLDGLLAGGAGGGGGRLGGARGSGVGGSERALGAGAGGGLGLPSIGIKGGSTTTGGFSLPPTEVRVRLEARDAVTVRSEQINALGSALLTLSGTVQDPTLTGRLESESGFVRFRGQRYEITRASLDLPPGSAGAALTLAAESEFRGYRVVLGLSGQIDALETTLRSEPPLSRDEILALITTGRTEAGPLTSQDPLRSGVGAAASLLSSGLISRPTEQLLGLSRFQIDPIIRPNTNPAARLTVGQQLSRNLYVSYSTNLATEQDQTALAEYTLTNRFSALTTYSQGGSSTRQGLDENVFTIELRGRQRFSLGTALPSPAAQPDPSPPSPLPATNAASTRASLPRAEVLVTQPREINLSEKKLRQLLPVMTQGFSRSLARLSERRLREYLQEEGYFFADVQSRCDPLDCSGPVPRVLFTIDLNEIYELKAIRLEGTTRIRLEEIRRELQSETASRVGGIPFLKDLPLIGGYVRGLTSNDRLRSDEELIRRRLVELGYLEARVRSRLALDPEQNDLLLLFLVEEGPLSLVGEVRFEGHERTTISQLRELVPLRVGEAFSPGLARLGTQQIRQHYAARGYLEAAVSLEVERDGDHQLGLRYRIVEGPQVVVSRIRIAGTARSGPGWIERYYEFRVGDILTPEKIRSTQASLYSTNAFREVLVNVRPLTEGETGTAPGHEVTLTLSEAKPLLFVYGLGYSTDDGMRGTLELANTNLRGSLDSLSFRFRASQREQIAQLSFSDLRPFGWRSPTTISTFYNRSANLRTFVQRRVLTEAGQTIDNPDGRGFGLERFGTFIQTERKLDARTSLRFRYNVERASLFGIDEGEFRGTEVTRNERVIRLGLLSAGISRDTRDNVLNPTRGQLISADHSLAAVPLGGNESFNKFFGTYQGYRTIERGTPWLGGTTIAFSARVGLASVFRVADRNEDGLISESETRLPISERFFSGGATTLRGFRFETAGPQEVLEARPGRGCDAPGRPCDLPTLVPIGGDALAILNFELRYPLTERLRFVPFYDLGNVFRRVRDLQPRRMTNTVGVGLRINTPIGPVGLDYGFLIDPPAFPSASGALIRQPRGVLHIRLGQSF
jgi:outer membrane protein assembly complex protein YaeT